MGGMTCDRVLFGILVLAAVVTAAVAPPFVALADSKAYRTTDGTSVTESETLGCLDLDMFVVQEGATTRCYWGYNGDAFTYDSSDKSDDNPSDNGIQLNSDRPVVSHARRIDSG